MTRIHDDTELRKALENREGFGLLMSDDNWKVVRSTNNFWIIVWGNLNDGAFNPALEFKTRDLARHYLLEIGRNRNRIYIHKCNIEYFETLRESLDKKIEAEKLYIEELRK